jgi:PAS domain S-box-containing protein
MWRGGACGTKKAKEHRVKAALIENGGLLLYPENAKSPGMRDGAYIEAALSSGDLSYRLLVDSVPDQVWTARPDGQLDFVNRRVVEYFGRTFDEVIGEGWQSVIHPEDIAGVLENWTHSLHTGAPYEVEFRLARADGVYRSHIGRALPRRDDSGGIIKWFGTNTDVEDQRRVEAALREREEREHFLAEAGRLLAASFDYHAALCAVAELAVPTLGDFCFVDVIDEGDAVQRVAWRHANEDARPWFNDIVRRLTPPRTDSAHPVGRALREGTAQLVTEITEDWLTKVSYSDEHLGFMKKLAFQSLITVPLIAEHHPIGALTFGLSESGRHYTPADLALAESLGSRMAVAIQNARLYQRMSRAVKVRDEIASIVSHDLRNPLNSMMMAASTLLDLDVGAEQRQKLLEVICSSGNLANRLLDDLLDAARIESGHLSVDLASQPVDSIIHETCEALEPSAAKAGITLLAEVDEDLPQILADRTRLLQVLGNLVTNAIKFSPRGATVTVRAQRIARGDDVQMSVSDTGIGIAAGDLPHVFDRFWQARRASRAGAGLGLAIAKGIVEAHGGSIRVESVEGAGSTFAFTIPSATHEPVSKQLVATL